MASSIRPVATIWLSAPSRSHGQNTPGGMPRRSPVATSTTARNSSENGKPNRKRILVAPQVPSGFVSDRCIALRATWPSAAMTVKGIQRLAMVNMGKWVGGPMIAANVPPGLNQVNHAHVIGAMPSPNSIVVLDKRSADPGPITPGSDLAKTRAYQPTPNWGNGSWPSPGRRRMSGSGAASHHAFRHHHVVHVHV